MSDTIDTPPKKRGRPPIANPAPRVQKTRAERGVKLLTLELSPEQHETIAAGALASDDNTTRFIRRAAMEAARKALKNKGTK